MSMMNFLTDNSVLFNFFKSKLEDSHSSTIPKILKQINYDPTKHQKLYQDGHYTDQDPEIATIETFNDYVKYDLRHLAKVYPTPLMTSTTFMSLKSNVSFPEDYDMNQEIETNPEAFCLRFHGQEATMENILVSTDNGRRVKMSSGQKKYIVSDYVGPEHPSKISTYRVIGKYVPEPYPQDLLIQDWLGITYIPLLLAVCLLSIIQCSVLVSLTVCCLICFLGLGFCLWNYPGERFKTLSEILEPDELDASYQRAAISLQAMFFSEEFEPETDDQPETDDHGNPKYRLMGMYSPGMIHHSVDDPDDTGPFKGDFFNEKTAQELINTFREKLEQELQEEIKKKESKKDV